MITISLNKQIHIYSVDTSAFYNEKEMEIHKRINRLHRHKRFLKDKSKKNKDGLVATKIKTYSIRTNQMLKNNKQKMYDEFHKSSLIRTLNEKSINKYTKVSVFDSALTRTLNMAQNETYKDIIIVKAYFFDILEDIILNGFIHENEKYICFTASAGQIRQKKTVFIKESLFLKYQKSLMCGLTIDEINKYGGININKYLAYLALCNSATDVWDNFDINKSIVVDDMETLVNGVVDFIDDKTYEIARQKMDIPINHTDGIGMMIGSVGKKNMMIRLPWIKGLLSYFPYDEFIKKANKDSNNEKNHGIIKDIYGKEYDILKDDIQVIFTKSQFKMYKYYKSWDDYKSKFIKYNCQAAKCNEEESKFENAKINYQMLQTLTDITDEELNELAIATKNNIEKISSDRATMLRVFGVNKNNPNQTYLQQALEVYPSLLSDVYTREILKQIKTSIVRDARSAKLSLDCKYTFIVPDLYGFCEYLFLGDKNPKGLLDDGQVSCKLYRKTDKLNCLRSPHLYIDHAVRDNIVDKKKERWFRTNALYTSCHDLISKILMFDVDGDKSLVVSNSTLVQVAIRNTKDVVPLYYNMRTAEVKTVNNSSIYEGLKLAYTGGNIGTKSNDISKIWNSSNVNLQAIKLLCMENNFTIDYAKTLYKPERPKVINKFITSYTKAKTPHFFIYAKDKDVENVEKINNSCVNRLEKIIEDKRIVFKKDEFIKFDYKLLMSDPDVVINEEIIKKYTTLDLKNHFDMNKRSGDNDDNFKVQYLSIRESMLELNDDIKYVVDVLVKHLYHVKKSKYKNTLWSSFGDVILDNIKNNGMDGTKIVCKKCGIIIDKSAVNKIYCEACTEYKPIENKVIQCIDCGVWIDVDGIVKNKKRCDSCQKNKDIIANRLRVQKFRNKM